ncbi:MAG TPA: hypothetical protein VKV15_10080 [Bryobacteraceae bacterium]|nr:hypothetical protein [Bryobacteraceae bacterium]
MRQNLDTLRAEIQEYLEVHQFIVFHGHSRLMDSLPVVYWDLDHYPDYRLFLKAAEATGSRLIVFHQREFSTDLIDNSLEQLHEVELAPAERRTLERRLKGLRVYEGFTCTLELSFDYQNRVYVFDLRTEWYNELNDILDEIDALLPEEEEDDEGPMGGYFSKN